MSPTRSIVFWWNSQHLVNIILTHIAAMDLEPITSSSAPQASAAAAAAADTSKKRAREHEDDVDDDKEEDIEEEEKKKKKKKPVASKKKKTKESKKKKAKATTSDSEKDDSDDDEDDGDDESEQKSKASSSNGHIKPKKPHRKKVPFGKGTVKRICALAGVDKKSQECLQMASDIMRSLADTLAAEALEVVKTANRSTLTAKHVATAAEHAFHTTPYVPLK